MVLIVTFRPEFEAPWIERPYVTCLTINRLAAREVGAMIDVVIGNKVLAPNMRLASQPSEKVRSSNSESTGWVGRNLRFGARKDGNGKPNIRKAEMGLQ